jgi:hypothetical protein
MATTERTATRAELIDRYVELAALDYVASGGWGWPTDDLFRLISLEDTAFERSDALAEELWPDEEGDRSPE